MQPRPSYYSSVHANFRAIRTGDWQAVIRFFEANEREIRAQDFEAYFEMLDGYATALFEVGAYKEHAQVADEVLEGCILENVEWAAGQAIFRKTLFRKATSCYHCLELGKASHALRELIKIDPTDLSAVALFKKVLRKETPNYLRRTKAAAILLFFISAFVICFEMLAVRNFFQAYTGTVELVRNGLFFLGIFLLVFGELYHWRRTNKVANQFLLEVRRSKKHSLRFVLPT